MPVQVSGEVSLACSWRVTPLDVVTMKVKQQQAEVDHKEEILALLQERYNIADASLLALPSSPKSDSKLAVVPRHKSFRVMSDEDPDIKRIVTYRGRLSVKVSSGFGPLGSERASEVDHGRGIASARCMQFRCHCSCCLEQRTCPGTALGSGLLSTFRHFSPWLSTIGLRQWVLHLLVHESMQI